jgi:predicted transcriptional regulator
MCIKSLLQIWDTHEEHDMAVEQKKAVLTRLPLETNKRLEQLAKRDERSVSFVIARAVRELVERESSTESERR